MTKVVCAQQSQEEVDFLWDQLHLGGCQRGSLFKPKAVP